MSFAMDILPRQIMHLIQLGLEEDIANCKTIWLCASCLACAARCPRGVNLCKIMEALRLITLRKNIDYVQLSKISPDNLAEFPQIALISSFRKHTA
jgi:heterodisulfide reductase subunit C